MSIVNFEQALQLLVSGQVVAIPTETVYGLAAVAHNADAVANIYTIKKRPTNHPLIVHVAKHASIEDWVETITPTARHLMNRYWPGSLTLLFKHKVGIFQACTAGQDTLALRCPAHPLTQRLLKALGHRLGHAQGALAAPSANHFGAVSPTTAQHVLDDYDGKVAVLDGGECSAGVESTIVDVRFEKLRILRHGAISQQDLETHENLVFHAPIQASNTRVSGSHAKHYAPQTPLRLVDHATIAQQWDHLNTNRIALITHQQSYSNTANVFTLGPDPKQYARQLYAQLRLLDKQGFAQIWVEQVPTDQAWLAIRDRLQRANFSA